MNHREMIKYLESNGFFLLRRQGGGHPIYTDGTSNVAMYGGKTSSWRASKNLMAEVQRAVRKRPQIVVDQPKKEEKQMGVEAFNKVRPEALAAPGVKPVMNGHDKEAEPKTEPVKRKKYDMVMKRKLENRIIDLYSQGKHEVEDVHRSLVAEGFPGPDKLGIIGMNHVRYYLYQLLETGVIKQVLVPPREVATAALTRKPGRLPDTVMGILTDPELTAEQKVRMISAYAEV